MSLLFLPHNVAHALVGGMFGMSADTSENTYYEVIPVLREVCPSQRWDAEKAWKKGEPPWHPDEVDRVLVNSFETPLRGPRGKGRPTRVNANATRSSTQVATDKKGEILSIDAGHRGPKADIRLYEESGVHQQFPNADKLGDKGYQSQAHSEIISPHK